MPEYAAFLDLAERYERVHLDTTMFATDFTESLMPFDRADLPLAELRAAWSATLPALFGGPEHGTLLTVPAGTRRSSAIWDGKSAHSSQAR